MKESRQKKILELIEREKLETQEELQSRLIEEGFSVTQATVSRDIRDLGLVKTADGQGNYRYHPSYQREDVLINEKHSRIFAEAARRCDCAGNLVVIHTYPGMGGAIGVAVDTMALGGVIGSLAGDDTLFIAVENPERAREICALFKAMIKN